VVKGIVYVYTPLLLIAYHSLYIVGYDHHIKNGSHDSYELAKAQDLKAKPASRVSAA
jgi:hypothetical protein